MDNNHLFHQLIVGPTFVPAVCKLLSEIPKMRIYAALWIDSNGTLRTRNVNQSFVFLSQGLGWVCQNLLEETQPSSHRFWKFSVIHAQMGTCFDIIMCVWALDLSTANVLLNCPLHGSPRGYDGTLVLEDETRWWLNERKQGWVL